MFLQFQQQNLFRCNFNDDLSPALNGAKTSSARELFVTGINCQKTWSKQRHSEYIQESFGQDKNRAPIQQFISNWTADSRQLLCTSTSIWPTDLYDL